MLISKLQSSSSERHESCIMNREVGVMYSELTNRGRGIQICQRLPPSPIYRSWRGNVTYLYNFEPFIPRERLKLGTWSLALRLIALGSYQKIKIRSKGIVNVSRDLLLEFWDHSISWERLKPCISKLAHRLITFGLYEKNEN